MLEVPAHTPTVFIPPALARTKKNTIQEICHLHWIQPIQHIYLFNQHRDFRPAELVQSIILHISHTIPDGLRSATAHP